jgi:hypothetical protein
MRLRTDIIGSLNLFSISSELDEDDLRIVRAMADIATFGIIQERSIRDSRTFAALRNYSRSHNLLLSESARAIISGSLSADVITADRPS